MADRQVPSVPAGLDASLRNFLSAVRDIVNSGATSSVVSSSATGSVDWSNITNLSGSATAVLSSISTKIANLLSSSVPDVPSGLTVSSGFNTIQLSWNPSSISNYAYTEIWRSPSSSFASAVVIGTSNGSIYIDNVSPGSSYYYWIRFVSDADIVGAYNSATGTQGQTTETVDALLTAKSWTITYDKIYAASAWIGSAWILDGAITNAKIGNTIQSDNYNGTVGWMLSKSGGNITVNDLTVKDTTGNIVMQSSAGGIDFSKVLNKTGFASISQITSGNISTYIASAAIGSTQIANAAIGNAQIGTAAVGTLSIAGEAVSVRRTYYGIPIFNVDFSTGAWTTVVDLAIPATTGNTSILFGFGYLYFGSDQSNPYDPGLLGNYTVRVVDNLGNVLFSALSYASSTNMIVRPINASATSIRIQVSCYTGAAGQLCNLYQVQLDVFFTKR